LQKSWLLLLAHVHAVIGSAPTYRCCQSFINVAVPYMILLLAGQLLQQGQLKSDALPCC
jgi:hypothetical protein